METMNQIQNPKSKIQIERLNYTLAVFYKRGEMASRAVAFAEPLWKNVPADYQIELIPREQVELLYPGALCRCAFAVGAGKKC
jgi:hypothetical protein